MRELVYLSAIYYSWGFQMLCFAIGIAFGVQMVIKIINYIEDYSLRRKEIALGKTQDWLVATLECILYFKQYHPVPSR